MTDIVERLRGIAVPITYEAAAELEQLRAESDISDGLLADAKAEVERLRALVKDLADDLEAEVNGHYPPEVRAYPSEQRHYERDMANVYEARRAPKAEVERLLGVCKDKTVLLKDAYADNERLRAALKAIEVYSSSHDDAKGMAFRALEPKP